MEAVSQKRQINHSLLAKRASEMNLSSRDIANAILDVTGRSVSHMTIFNILEGKTLDPSTSVLRALTLILELELEDVLLAL